MTRRDTESDQGRSEREIVERNVEASRRLLEERRNAETAAEHEDEPARNDPRHNDQNVAPGQTSVPLGGTSNPNSQGGSSKRHKPN
jgi:hypothetical protein